jgi:hypothetical protein
MAAGHVFPSGTESSLPVYLLLLRGWAGRRPFQDERERSLLLCFDDFELDTERFELRKRLSG